MNTWYTKNLGDAMLAREETDQIKELFLIEYGIDNQSNELAVFIRHESEGHLHCEVKVYFPPALAVMARMLDADTCRQPSLDGLSLLVGSEASWLSLFPDRNR